MIEQLVVQVRAAIEHGRLPAGSRLPASRVLARELEISRTVVTEAYAILIAEGYLESKHGSGTYVVEGPGGGDAKALLPSPVDPLVDSTRRPRWLRRVIDPPDVDPSDSEWASFRICEPDPESFPDGAWRTCARAALNEPLPPGYAPVEGDETLRQAIASFLARERGLRCSPQEILITSGTTQSLDLIARAVLQPGDTVAFEDPGYRLARQIFTDREAQISPLPLDSEGLTLESLNASEPPILIYTTPSHQFPTGYLLSYRRRLELLEWAARHEVLVLEDDYDSEFRFDGPALPALAMNDPNVVYLGTFSKSLAPVLRLGYMIAPSRLREAVLQLKVRTDYHSNWLHQRTLAHYMMSGGFARHLRRMRRVYRERRDALVRAFEPLPAGCNWIGLAAGLHASLHLPDSFLAARVAERCAERQILLRTLADYALQSPMNGLVFGYGACPEPYLTRLSSRVREAFDPMLR